MRVLAVIDTLGYGGAERLLVSLLPLLARRGIQCEVAAAMPPYSLAGELEQRGIPVHKLGIAHRWLVPQAARRISYLCRTRNITIVWGHLYFGNLYAAAACTFAKALKVIWTLHFHAYAATPGRLWDRVRMGIERAAAKLWVDAVVGVSDNVVRHYRRIFPWEISRIYNGIPVSGLPPPVTPLQRLQLRSKLGLEQAKFLVVTPARLSREKGHWVLCEALRIFARQRGWYPSWIVIGAGPERPAIEQRLKSAGIAGAVRIMEPVPQPALFEIIQSSDAVVLPSLWGESFGLAAAESMALGVPTILSSIEAFVELAGEEGAAVLVPPAEPHELAEAMWRLHADERLRGTVASAGCERVRRHFDVESMASHWEMLFRRLG